MSAKTITSLFLGLLSFFQLVGQPSSFYEYKSTNVDKQKTAVSFLTNEFNSLKKSTKNKELKKFYTNRYHQLLSKINNDEFLFDNSFHTLLNKILSQIKQENPSLNIPIHSVLIGRSPIPNAYCYGNGFIVVNLGLIRYLNNEDQLAFIIAHELSHKIFEHVDENVKSHIAYVNSKAFKRRVKLLKKYNEYDEKADKLEAFYLYNKLIERKHNRYEEIQADSMASALIENTSFNKEEALCVINILDKIDSELLSDSIEFKTIFTTKNQNFNTYWIKDKSGFSVKEEIDKKLVDSLKTHPDCAQRIKLLGTYYEFTNNYREHIDKEFADYKLAADFEIILHVLKSEDYIYGLKHLLSIHDHKQNPFLKTLFTIYLGEIYLAMKSHTLKGYEPHPRDEFSYNYRKTLLLIQNIRLSELKKLYEDYFSTLHSNYSTEEINNNEHLYYTSLINAKINGREDVFKKLKTNYLKNYSTGIYYKKLNQNP